ncbi:MAG: class I SAM-dependent methyltransferase [Pseudohongiellaceae bacterium]
MNTFLKNASVALLALGLSTVTLALPADFDAKLQDPARPQTDKDRDAARKPRETMETLGVQEGWTVIDVSAGGGWFTHVISAAVGPNGKVLAQFGTRPLETNNGQAQKDMAARLGNVEPVFAAMSEIPANSADAAVTALNFHDAYNFRGEEGAQAFLKDIFNALKSGGIAAIIDHEGNEGNDNQALHRLPKSIAREQIQKAGFEIVSESDVLDNPEDDHSLEVRDTTLGRATDQFFFVVRKP